MDAPLSYTSQFGYYGLRVNPGFEQVVGTIRKPLRVPLPERRAKWYATGPYRALILDAEQRYQDYEAAAVDYKRSGAELPEAAARARPSDAGEDPAWNEIHEQGDRMEAQSAYESAFDLMNQEHQRETEATRREQLRRGYGPNRMHPVIEATHEELVEAGVPHYIAEPREPLPRRVWHTPPPQFAAAGQPQATEFRTFEQLNMGQPANFRTATLSPAQNATYERMREFTVQPTWSS